MLQLDSFVPATTWSERGLLARSVGRRPAVVVSLTAIALFALFTAMATAPAALAGTIFPGQYQLLDHPDGSENPPPYGLRVDALGGFFVRER